MLSGPGQFAENETNEVNFREIPSHVLQKVCMYFTYKVGKLDQLDLEILNHFLFRLDTPTAPQKYQSFPSHQRLHWSC